MTTRQEQSRKAAIEMLAHYFKTVFGAAGLPWNADNEQEIAGAVDAIIETAGEAPESAGR